MPIYNWFKWHEEKDNSYLSKTRKIGSLVNYFGDKIMTQFIERFGFSETFIKALEKEKELVLLQARMAITEDRSLSAFIKICQIEIEALRAETQDRSDFYEIKGVLEHEMGFQIDIKKVSVAEYYTYFKALKKIRPKQNG
jgi:phenylalanine-4-hydroxylase